MMSMSNPPVASSQSVPPPYTKVTDVPDDRKWTVMVFMGTDTERGNAPLDEAADDDIAEMRSVGSGDKLNIFVQVHSRGVPRRYHLGIDDGEDVPEDQRDVTAGRALAHFIESSLMKKGVEHRQQDHSMLVLWGHAYDFAIGKAPTRSGTVDALDFVELSGVFRGLQDKMRTRLGSQELPTLDIVAFDCCDVATVEIACQLQPFAKYMLGSQIGVPLPGWPYDRVLKRLGVPFGRRMGAAEFGSYAVRRYCQSYVPLDRTVSLTLLDLKRANELFARTEVLATVLDLAVSQGPDTRDLIARLFSRSQTAENKPYVDVADLCLNLVRECGDALIIEAARALGDFLLAPMPDVAGQSCSGAGRPFVVEHGRNACETAKLNGVSLYAPHVAPINDFALVRDLYNDFEFVRETRWSRLVHTLAGSR